MILTSLFYLLSRKGCICAYPTVRTTMVLVSILFTYLLIQAWLCQSKGFKSVVQVFIANIIVISCCGVILENKTYNHAFFKTMVYIFAVLGISSIVTLLLSLSVPSESLYIYSFSIRGYDYLETIYFPVSFFCKDYDVTGDILLPRFNGLFREPGIFQAFSCWAIFYALHHRLNKWLVFGLVASTLLTFSPAAIATLTMTSMLWFVMKRKASIPICIIWVVLGAIVAAVLLYYLPFIGIKDKVELHPASLDDRFGATLNGLSLLRQYPLGIGFYNYLGNFWIHNSGINLLAQSGYIGFPGMILAILVYFAPVFSRSHNSLPYIIAVFPILLTSIFAQPLLDQPFVYVVLLTTFANVQETKHSQLRFC